MKRRLVSLASMALLASASAIPAGLGASDALAAHAAAPDPSGISTSSVWWDIYSMCKDRWLDEHPTYTEFNPYYVTPKYGSYHSESLIGSALGMVPSGPDVYVYMWFDTSGYSWNGATATITYSSSDEVGEEGYTVVPRTATAELVSEYGMDRTGRANWLAKYRFTPSITDSLGEVKHIQLMSFAFECPGDGGETETVSIDLSDDLQWTGDISDGEGFDWRLESDNYVDIRRKKVEMILEPDRESPVSPSREVRMDDFNDSSTFLKDWDMNTFNYAERGEDWYLNLSSYTRMQETTYCFFEPADYFEDGVRVDYPINQVTEIVFSFNRMTYQYVSSDITYTWYEFVDNYPCYSGLYGEPKYDQYLQENGGDAYFTEPSYELVEDKVEIGQDEAYVTRDERKFLFWEFPEERSRMDAIVDCENASGWEDDPDYATLLEFIQNNKWDYRWAFRVDSTVREAAMHGKESFLWNRRFRTESTCHEVTDLAVLRLKFSNVQNEAFDLRALDATDQTEPEPFVPSTGGNSYGVGGYYVPNYGSDLNAWDNFLDVVKIVGAVAGAVLVIWGVIRLAPAIAAVKGASKK